MRRTIKNLIEGYERRQFTPSEILDDHLRNIKSNKNINSFITVLEKRSERQATNLKMQDLTNDKALFGIPISYKDSIDIIGTKTTNGSAVPVKKVAKKNAKIVEILEMLGSITVGKNNLHEFSTGVTSENAYYGNVINPLNRKYTAGGSSGGSAASVAAGLVTAAIGTDTSGSVRIPAACCGVPSIKLTYNPELLHGVTPMSHTLDHIGVIANSVEDLSKISTQLSSKMEKANHENLNQVKIGIDLGYFSENVDKKIDEMMRLSVNKFNDLGVQIVKIDLSYFADIVSFSRIIGTTEASFHHQKLFDEFSNEYDNHLFETVKAGRSIKAHSYLEALLKKSYWTKKINQEFDSVDLILTPLMPITIPTLDRIKNWNNSESIEDCMVRYTQPFNMTGHPAISLLSGYQTGLMNQSIQLISQHNKESLLFDIAKLYEEKI